MDKWLVFLVLPQSVRVPESCVEECRLTEDYIFYLHIAYIVVVCTSQIYMVHHMLVYVCRYPLPNHYTVTLEVSRNRTTAAYYSVCDSSNPDKPKCPPPLNDGDTYLHRTLNEPCHEMVCSYFLQALHRSLSVVSIMLSNNKNGFSWR